MSAGSASAVRRRWPWLLAAAVVLAVVVVVVARLLRFSDAGEAFVSTWSGTAPQPDGVPAGFPAWAAWQHGLNAAFLLFTVRSGWRIHRAGRPATFWTRRNDGRIRTAHPPVRIAIDLWSHFVADTLWVLNGVVFVVLCAVSGHWARIVPTDWAVVPQAVSAGLQYASFAWPTEDGWVDYNALQQLSYFVVVYVAGPIAILTGLRAAPGFAARLRFLDARFPLRTAKTIHWWTMWFFVAFTAVHVFLVLATGAIRNLNHIYAVRDDESPAGLVVFLVSLVLTAALVLALRPPVVRWAAARTGTVLHRPPKAPRPR
ncbi:cytochrome b/b6 domain-containing protein [Amnibacterium kyonggiense]|uniref:Thiosulfate reductase cytochrome b subunit n=1 Tax=Amnibacterium kyonggiense TaxID=595671 RepID=A0A4R7FJB6_9MICO|nr:cytochrome b/b6 domain-containing protein [Amnibacterium kyonggiense]TDS76136.1 thiosulfate reductase cytochrome b subunit [Amnibacterium kyonggiense]